LVVDFDTTVNSSPTDISGQGNHGAFLNGASYSAADKAFTFDASTEMIYTNGASGLPTGDAIYSMSAWIKQEATPSSGTHPVVFGFGSAWASDKLAIINLRDGNKLGSDIGSSSLSSTDVVITQNQWHHVVICKVGTGLLTTDTIRLYVDGVEITDKQLNNAARTQSLDTSIYVSVGAAFNSQTSPTSPFTGKVSNPKIYNVALEASEVQKLYRLGRTGRSMVISDTAVGIGKVPEAQLDVRGTFRAPGTIVQVEQTVKTNTSAVTSTSVVDIEYLSVDITPKFSTSKILVSYIVNVGVDITGTSNCHGFLRVKRTQGGTSTYIGDGASSGNRQACTSYIYNTVPNACDPFSFEHLDDANGTGTVTYTIQGLVEHSVYTMTINRSGSDGNNGYYGRTTSSITAKEVCQ